uniref:zinc finger domain-containing protein n=1 Tax=Pseudomonas donghuensis TaxID=1163398 RepID=UPI001CB923A3
MNFSLHPDYLYNTVVQGASRAHHVAGPAGAKHIRCAICPQDAAWRWLGLVAGAALGA